MPDTSHEGRFESPPTLLAWGQPSNDARNGGIEAAAVWLTGGAGLLLWTALAFLLTS